MTETAEETVEVIDGMTTLAAVDRASIDVQIATAKQHPRSVAKAMKEARELATLDEETAGSMFYALPRGGKTIEGPSARLAEIMAYAWGNLRVDADIVAEDKTHITAMGTCFDLERNVAVRVRVKRRITNKDGKRYDEDMIGVTGNAAVSIALRNAVFKVIPAALVHTIYAAARTASLGQGGTLTQKRHKALAWFAKIGVAEADVFRVLNVSGPEDMGEDALIILRGMVTAIKDGDTTVEQLFRQPRGNGQESSVGAKDLDEALTGKNGEAPLTPTAPTELREFQALCTAYKTHLGEERYRPIMEPYGGKSNATRPQDFAVVVTALHAACTTADQVEFPPADHFAAAQQFSKEQLRELVPAAEAKCLEGATLRPVYLGAASVEKAVVAPLRVYYAMLTSLETA